MWGVDFFICVKIACKMADIVSPIDFRAVSSGCTLFAVTLRYQYTEALSKHVYTGWTELKYWAWLFITNDVVYQLDVKFSSILYAKTVVFFAETM